ncbi:XapX domain-containing protein [Fervidicella metallireducens AeB]|uniref:XapX domain-containing protein n=1 Tax=Fervidicella metallireducens AeB TaxID=1403537 RepID=A0A017RRC4_9CLOT|nr:DUF1427 family protein [Fervidicella metallireducens]EYE87126.1 XapX domain-containing protein [Fervidicella metallireducens AeB]
MKEIFLSLLTGMLAGFIFAKMSLPIPAPPTLDGFMGIFGVWLGSALVELIIRKHA